MHSQTFLGAAQFCNHWAYYILHYYTNTLLTWKVQWVRTVVSSTPCNSTWSDIDARNTTVFNTFSVGNCSSGRGSWASQSVWLMWVQNKSNFVCISTRKGTYKISVKSSAYAWSSDTDKYEMRHLWVNERMLYLTTVRKPALFITIEQNEQHTSLSHMYAWQQPERWCDLINYVSIQQHYAA